MQIIALKLFINFFMHCAEKPNAFHMSIRKSRNIPYFKEPKG